MSEQIEAVLFYGVPVEEEALASWAKTHGVDGWLISEAIEEFGMTLVEMGSLPNGRVQYGVAVTSFTTELDNRVIPKRVIAPACPDMGKTATLASMLPGLGVKDPLQIGWYLGVCLA